jgi:hypothetical protein
MDSLDRWWWCIRCVEDGGCTTSQISVLSPLSLSVFSRLNHNIFFLFLGVWVILDKELLREIWGKFERVENWKANFAIARFSLVKCEFFWLTFQWFHICVLERIWLLSHVCWFFFFFFTRTLSNAYYVAMVFFFPCFRYALLLLLSIFIIIIICFFFL